MTQHHHDHGHAHHEHPPARPGLHKDWRAWVVVGLMLAAMVAYILSLDESIQPGEVEGERVPATAE